MKLQDRLKVLQQEQLRRRALPVDPAQFKDPLALRVDWFPAAGGGANFRTHRLVERRPGRLEFRPTSGMVGFGAGILLMGVAGALAFGYAAFTHRWISMAFGFGGAVLICLMFVIAGMLLLWSAGRPVVFDRSRGWFWIGRRGPGAGDERSCRLSDIHALQLIKEHCGGRDGDPGYWSYELNLVRRDGSRIHVVDHGSRDELLRDAERLGIFLGCRLWNATPSGDNLAAPR